jgi:hypothetical protein
MRKLSFEDAFTWAVFVLSLVLLAVPFFTGEQTLGSLFNNKLALIGAAALILLFVYKLRALLACPEQATTSVPTAAQTPPVAGGTPVTIPGESLPAANANVTEEIRRTA